MTPSERISHVLVAIPLAHVLGSALFLWSYCTGFGAHLAAHASASDLLSVSISDMVLAYIASLAFPALLAIIRLSSSRPYAIDVANSITDPRQREIALRSTVVARKVIIYSGLAFAAVFCGRGIFQIINGMQIPYLSFYAGVFPVVTFSVMFLFEKKGYPASQYEITSLLCSFILALFFTGLDKGQTDRFRYYESEKGEYTRCQDAIVLRQMSGNYLAIMPDNSKAIISHECKVIFAIPSPRGPNPLPVPKLPHGTRS